MRYLKLFEEMSNTDEDLKEICYDLTDDGRFYIKIDVAEIFVPGWDHISDSGINLNLKRDDKIIYICLSDRDSWNHGFSFDEVREVILRIIDYLGDRYKGCSVLSVNEHRRSNINKVDIIEYNCIDILNLLIIYK